MLLTHLRNNYRYFGLITALITISLLAVSCKREAAINVDMLVKVGDKYLSREELKNSLPMYLNTQDSILMSEHYIRMWINDVLLYDVARKNIDNEKEIAQLVDSYRKSLIIHQYQEQLVNEKLSREIDNQDLTEFYNNNENQFKLEYPLIKGMFLKIPTGAPNIEQVRHWAKSTTPASIDKIEKYSVQNAVNYDNFVNGWVDFNELIHNWPVDYANPEEILKNNSFLEQHDDNYYYFLNITDYLLTGANAPFEYAQTTVREMLINQRKIKFLHTLEDDLYNKALKNGQIVFYNE
ncbi:MAG: peptidyl-prolyl cis-trans isomerase [Dysgonamonadaceae bacterium]|jgi:hypothetical protein|nr:peptidyl-prolyl cis-trans isomerase [Dysgonamonadaceae bacterium]